MWRLWIDTGGTFTDCLALDPAGELHRAKVLSSSGLRGSVVEVLDADQVRLRVSDGLPDGFLTGSRLRRLGSESEWRVASDEDGVVSLSVREEVGGVELAAGDPVELRFDQEAPILAARLVTASARVEDLPALELRLATTRGTNALLERRGARTVFLVTAGFADLLRIGDQRRPDLFALRIERPEPLYERVVEIDERLDAEGRVVRDLDVDAARSAVAELRAEGLESAAVAFLHSYLDPRHEKQVEEALRAAGFDFVSTSAALSPSIKILPRAETAVVDAYLSPVVESYLRRVRDALAESAGGPKSGVRLRVMTSAGGLVSAERFRAKDSLLSGPAGGVVGASRVGRELGLRRLIAFDMGGTSTDVSRFDGDFDYRFEQRVGDARIAAPSLAIETVAAGGGSICGLDGRRLTVGPESAGASPGPACYGAGGPLTLTDVNLLLGRLDPDRFGIPVDLSASEKALGAILEKLPGRNSDTGTEALLRGFLEIADLRMAGAVRQISVRQGYDPRDFSLVAFGGAGGQHACAVAEELGMETVVLPREAGLLSALGLGSAVVERFAQRQVLRELDDDLALADRLDELADEALGELRDEGIEDREARVRRRVAFLRFAGQDATLEVEADFEPESSDSLAARLRERFHTAYERRFGYRPDDRAIEVESLRVVASSAPSASGSSRSVKQERLLDADWGDGPEADRLGHRRAYFDGWREVPVFEVARLPEGRVVTGPALIFDPHASLTLAPGWRATRAATGSVVARRQS